MADKCNCALIFTRRKFLSGNDIFRYFSLINLSHDLPLYVSLRYKVRIDPSFCMVGCCDYDHSRIWRHGSTNCRGETYRSYGCNRRYFSFNLFFTRISLGRIPPKLYTDFVTRLWQNRQKISPDRGNAAIFQETCIWPSGLKRVSIWTHYFFF